MKTALELIAEERQRQIEKGFDARHDDYHDCGELALAAACHAAHPLSLYSMEKLHNAVHFDKLTPFDEYEVDDTKSRIRNLTIAAALIVAEIERYQRMEDAEAEMNIKD